MGSGLDDRSSMEPRRPTPVEVHVEVVDDCVNVTLRGELDLATTEPVWHRIEPAVNGARTLVLDLRDTTFIDSTGMAMLVKAHHRLGTRPGGVVVRAANPAARRLLAITGIDGFVTIEDGL